MEISVLGTEEVQRLLGTDNPEAIATLLSERSSADPDDCAEPLLDLEELGLSVVGSGTSAAVFAHKDHPDLVIRVSEEEDGWVGYACDGEPNPHKPVVLSLAWTGLCWVAVCERLLAVSQEQADDFERAFWEAPEPGSPPPNAAARLLADIEARGLCADDVCRRNILQRPNGETVLNDPVAALPFRLMMDLKGRFDWNAASQSPGF